MKIKNLMMGFVLSLCSVAAFANSALAAGSKPLPLSPALNAAASVIVSKPFSNTCTVTVKFGRVSSTMTATCECTLKEACARAYSFAVMLAR